MKKILILFFFGALILITKPVLAARWVLPTSFSDPSTFWTFEEKAYDNDLGTMAIGTTTAEWSGVLHLYHSPMTSDRLRYYVDSSSNDDINEINITARVDGTEVIVYYGAWNPATDEGTWHTKTFTEGSVDRISIQFNDSTALGICDLALNEFHFYKIYHVDTTLNHPTNTTYTTSTIDLNVTCTGTENSYEVNRSLDGGSSVVFGKAINGTVFQNTTTLSGLSDGGHNIVVSCYNDTRSPTVIDTSTKLYFTTDITAPRYSNNATNETNRGFPCNFTLDWEDTGTLSGHIFSTNNSGTWKNASWSSMSGKSDTSENVTTLNGTVGVLVQWKFYANDTGNRWNVSDAYNLSLTSYPYYSLNSTNTTLAGQPTEFRLYWDDLPGLSGHIFSWYNGANWTWYNKSSDQESGEIQYKGESAVGSCSGTCACYGLADPAGDCNCDSMTCTWAYGFCYGSCSCSEATTQACCEAHGCTWTPGSVDDEKNKTYTTYSNIFSDDTLEVTTNITVTVNISIFNNTGSFNNSNSDPDLFLEVHDGSSWVEIGNMSVSGTGNVSKSTTTIGWNNQVRLKGMYFDYNSTTSGYDEINYTDVWAQVDSNQEFMNNTWVSMTGTGNWSNVTKTTNSTVGSTIKWIVYANDTDDNWNTSDVYSFVTTTAVGKVIDVTMSPALSGGIQFGTIIANTIGNPAQNNTVGYYNLTVDPASTDPVDIYVNLSSLFGSGIDVNESSSTTSETSGFFANTTITESWTILGNSTNNCTNLGDSTNCWIRFYMDASSGISSGFRSRNISYCAVYNKGNPDTLCG